MNWSSRAVIGPGVGLDINELGVPEPVWRTQTVPERCTPFNVAKLRALLAQGEVESVDVAQPDRKKCNKLAKWASPEDVQVGCTVHRLLQTGDSIVFNRCVYYDSRRAASSFISSTSSLYFLYLGSFI